MNPATSVLPLPAELATQVSNLIQNVIEDLDYYNDRAKREEQAKYTPEKLLDLIREDEESVLIAALATSAIGFCISRYDDGLIWGSPQDDVGVGKAGSS